MENQRIVSQYILERKLGEGGMAEVWEARHLHLGSLAAVKFLLPRFAGDPELELRFLNEGKRQARLQHPNIVSAIDFLQVDGRSYLIMQFVDGQNLEQLIKERNGPLTLEEVHAISWDVLSALDYAHAHDIVHRDVKPSNILLDSTGRVSLTDFGIALAMKEEQHVTRTGQNIGTSEYMSPEQILRPRSVDPRTDIYNFGLVLYAMLTGNPPFGGDEQTEFFIKDCHVRMPPPPMRDRNPYLPEGLEEVVFKCLEKNPDMRFQTCGEVMRALDPVLVQSSEEEPRPVPVSPVPVGAPLRAPTVLDSPALDPVRPQGTPPPPPTPPAGFGTPNVSEPLRPEREAKKKRGWLMPALLGVAVCLLGAALLYAFYGKGGPAGTETAIRMEGSTSVGLELAPAMLKAYLADKGATDIQTTIVKGKGEEQTFHITATMPGKTRRQEFVIVANGTGKAFAALKNGTADIGMASSPINDAQASDLSAIGDFRSDASEKVVGLDGIAVVVNSSNPVQTLTRSQIGAIFAGGINDWAQVGGASAPIHTFIRNKDSGTRGAFGSMVLKKGTDFSPEAQEKANGQEIANAVASDPGGIGFVALPQVGNARALAVSDGAGTAALLPTAFTVSTEDYILSRRLFLYVPPKTSELVQDFIKFATHDAGQTVTESVGYVPLKAVAESVPTPAGAPVAYRQITEGKRRVRLNFRFRPNSDQLDTRAVSDIDRALGLLKGKSEVYLLGFADSKKGPVDNHTLSERRAYVVGQEFQKRGIHANIVGFGSEMPVGDNNTDAGRDKNRRVEIWVS